MSEQGKFEFALEIATKLAAYCDSEASANELIKLIKELLEVRWSISPEPSA